MNKQPLEELAKEEIAEEMKPPPNEPLSNAVQEEQCQEAPTELSPKE